MKEMICLKEIICAGVGIVGAAISSAFGGWTTSIKVLLALMIIDYVSGLVCAGVFHKSQKSANGALESKACFKGLVRKGMILMLVLVGHYLDVAAKINYVKDLVCIAFMASEAISITENAGLMGVPVPKVIMKAIDILKEKGNETDEKGDKTDEGN